MSYADSNNAGGILPRDMNSKYCEDMGDGIMACYDVWMPGEVVEVNNYYPFGLMHNYTATMMNSYQYKYNGKELQETGMYDYGWRFYMPDIGRWGVVDPLSEKGHNFSPYNYAINNPIRFIDPDGLWISITDGDNTYRYSKGQTQHKVDGKWVAADNVDFSDNVVGIITGLRDLENGGATGKELVSYFDNDKHDVNIMYDKGNAGDAGVNSSDPLKIDPKKSTQTPTTNGLVDSPFFISLGHELGHKKDPMKKGDLFGGWFGVSRGEIFGTHVENMIRAENGLPLRTSYRKNSAVREGLDIPTVLIDCTGNSLYYDKSGRPLNNTSADDRLNAARSIVGTAAASVLTGKYNYYDNAKRTKKN